MCEVLVTADGIELRTVGEVARYGIGLPEWASEDPDDRDRCLCELDLPAVLAGRPSAWREGFAMPGDGWCEVGADGRTWHEGFDLLTKDPKYPRSARLGRSDGRTAMTLDDWEAASARYGAVHA